METMNEKLVHLEFMKAALTGSCAEVNRTFTAELIASCACQYADSALIEYQKRWEGEEKV